LPTNLLPTELLAEAQGIFEIGKDVADRIRTKQAELANSSLTTLDAVKP
jgi:hypothetical protein